MSNIETNTHEEHFELIDPSRFELAYATRTRVDSIGERLHDEHATARIMGALSLHHADESGHILADHAFWAGEQAA